MKLIRVMLITLMVFFLGNQSLLAQEQSKAQKVERIQEKKLTKLEKAGKLLSEEKEDLEKEKANLAKAKREGKLTPMEIKRKEAEIAETEEKIRQYEGSLRKVEKPKKVDQRQ